MSVYDEWDLRRKSIRSRSGVKNYAERANLQLHGGSTRDVFTVEGVVMVTGMFMRITTAVTNSACNMSWIYDPDDGSADQAFGDTVAIANSVVGDRYYSELDGSNLVKIAAGAELNNILDIKDRQASAFTGRGLILFDGGIDIILSAHAGLLAGAGQMWIEYEPISMNAKIWPGRIHSTTSTTSSTTSSTSSTSSTTSTTSSTSSTASTSSTTSSTASTSSTTSTTSSTTSAAP